MRETYATLYHHHHQFLTHKAAQYTQTRNEC